jgi:predicted RNA binding protein YcfA (HicA-like mRNA interferase family)
MKLPRDISASDLIKYLKRFGYEPTRQTGSHIRLSTIEFGQHHITIPNHNPIKVGTLSAILSSIAEHRGITKDELITQLLS